MSERRLDFASPSTRRATATIAVVTFVVLVTELTSTRLFAYIGSSHATSTALSIALLGLGIGAAARVRFPQWAEPGRAVLGLAAALLALATAAIGGVGVPGLVALSVLVFAIAGALVSDAYAIRGAGAARRTYAIDLSAAAAGCVVAPRLVGPLSPMEILLALGLVCCALGAFAIERRPRWVATLAVLALGHAGVFGAGRAGALPDGPLEVLMHSARGEKSISDAGTATSDVVDSAWSPLGRLDVRRIPDEGDRRLGVFTDGMSPTYLVNEANARGDEVERTWGLLMSLPYRALQPRRVLVLGAGAGASAWLAIKYGASNVDAVEVNPAITGVLARRRSFAGDVYGQPGVRLVIADARRYLADTEQRYDLIELALALTGNVHTQAAGMEAHLYTVEAVRLYLRRLAPGGSLVLIHSDPGNAYRQLLTVLAALEANGIARDRALEGIVVLRDPRQSTAYQYLLVVRASPMPLDVADALDVEPAELLWAPGDPPERRATLLDPRTLGATAADDFTPVHDDRPYFFQNTRGLAATALAEPGRLWALAGALLLALVLVVERRRDATAFTAPAAVAFCLGAAFLTVELALIQRFTLAAGGTLYAVSFVLFAVLAWSAAGALVLGRVWRGHAWASACAALAVAVIAFVTRDTAWLDAITSDAGRLAAIALLVCPVGLAIGAPFPSLLAAQGEPVARIASLWAVNGAASVAGGVLAVLALRVAGATHALVVASVLYACAAGIGVRRPARR